MLVVSFAAYWIWQLAFVLGSHSIAFPENGLFTTIYGLFLVGLCYKLLQSSPKLSTWVWSLGLSVAAVGATILFRSSLSLFIMPLAHFIAALLLGAIPGAVVAALSLAALFFARLHGSPLAMGDMAAVAAQCATAVGAGFALHRGMQTMVDWTLASYQNAIHNMLEARERRGEIAKIVKELDLAYQRLARVNSSLVEAWQRATEAERRRAELVTLISHELRTPLNLVLGFSEMIIGSPESYDSVPLPPVYRSDMNAIYRSSRHLLELTDDVLDLARADVGKLALLREDTDVGSVVLEAGAMVKEYVEAKGLALITSVQPNLPQVSIDRLRIRQVLLNLLTNAARFTEAGYIKIDARLQEGTLCVSVEDSGRGISAEQAKDVFQEFGVSTARDEKWHAGTGLGLPISKKLIELHGGRMWLESRLGRGTIFCFTLPISTEEPGQAPLYNDPLPRHLSGKPSLVVATVDTDLVRTVQREIPNAEVVVADDPVEASQKATEYRARMVVIDSDDDVPSDAWKVPVLQLSLPDRHRRAKAVGAQLILPKPLAKEQLLQALSIHAPDARCILVVDDDPRFVDLIRRMLGGKSGPWEVLAAYTAEEALAVAKAQKIEAFLLDQSLPDLKGVELCRRLRLMPEYHASPVLFVTAYEPEMLVGERARRMVLAMPDSLGGVQALRLVRAIFEALGFQGAPASALAMPLAE
jgi:signal transduction histidine kinase/CheY-like chemotaxis protein